MKVATHSSSIIPSDFVFGTGCLCGLMKAVVVAFNSEGADIDGMGLGCGKEKRREGRRGS
jgi:hypothetical protein